uniref:C2H2-type domain-containing protein n=1 Tax=viral metagenome TaxID=1070528 RepID=A0A6H1ZJY9_9ZZZZ
MANEIVLPEGKTILAPTQEEIDSNFMSYGDYSPAVGDEYKKKPKDPSEITQQLSGMQISCRTCGEFFATEHDHNEHQKAHLAKDIEAKRQSPIIERIRDKDESTRPLTESDVQELARTLIKSELAEIIREVIPAHILKSKPGRPKGSKNRKKKKFGRRVEKPSVRLSSKEIVYEDDLSGDAAIRSEGDS